MEINIYRGALREIITVCQRALNNAEKPKVIPVDGPAERKARLVKALKARAFPIHNNEWTRFCNTAKSYMHYQGRDISGDLIPFVLGKIDAGMITEGMIDTLLEMVIE